MVWRELWDSLPVEWTAAAEKGVKSPEKSSVSQWSSLEEVDHWLQKKAEEKRQGSPEKG